MGDQQPGKLEEHLDLRPPRFISAVVRAGLSVTCGLIVGAGAARFLPWQGAILLGWCGAAATFIIWVLVSISGKSAPDTAALATREDGSRSIGEFMLLGSSAASLAAVALVLLKLPKVHGQTKALLSVTAVLSVVLSWAVVHLLFTLRYARLFYSEPRGGIDFNQADGADPRYVDFAYMAFTVGMTYQVSDTDITQRPIRATILRHGLLSYMFGTAIIAMTINLIAGLAK